MHGTVGQYRKWTRAENDKIAALYEAGAPPRIIAIALDTTAVTIEGKVREWGLKRQKRYRKWTANDAEKVRSLIKEGWSQVEIARHFGRSRGSIAGFVHRLRLEDGQ